jgi:hypothetical protein
LAVYKVWDEFRNHFPKKSRNTLGAKIDSLFIDTIELLFVASYLSKEQKLPYVQRAGDKLNLLKLFLQIAWEFKTIDNNKYITLSRHLDEIGKMIGGWIKGLQNKTPAV